VPGEKPSQALLQGADPVDAERKRANLAQAVQDHRVRVVRAVMSTSMSINVVEQEGEVTLLPLLSMRSFWTYRFILASSILEAQDCPSKLSNVYAKILRVSVDKKRKMWQVVQQAVRPGLVYFDELFHNLKEDNTDDDDPVPVCFREVIDLFRFARMAFLFHVE